MGGRTPPCAGMVMINSLLLVLGFRGGSARTVRRRLPTPAPRDPIQLPLDGAGARKHPPVHLIESAVRRVEHQSAGRAYGNADGAPVEFDCETLRNHWE